MVTEINMAELLYKFYYRKQLLSYLDAYTNGPHSIASHTSCLRDLDPCIHHIYQSSENRRRIPQSPVPFSGLRAL